MGGCVEPRGGTGSVRLVRGECLDVLRREGDETYDAVVTDPPYSSGGTTSAERTGKTVAQKYHHKATKKSYPDFAGDNRDQRSWAHWCALWLAECHRVARRGAYLLAFADWRQLPSLTDAVQAGGWTWRGVIAWDKTEGARSPHTGYWRHQCEYVVWATKGPVPRADGRGPWPGCLRHPVKHREKLHQTGKPPALMRDLLRCVRPGGRVIDPFAGSGTTLLEAAALGLDAVGAEVTPQNFAVARDRLAAALPPGAFEAVEARTDRPDMVGRRA